jgi:hypothetical protein
MPAIQSLLEKDTGRNGLWCHRSVIAERRTFPKPRPRVKSRIAYETPFEAMAPIKGLRRLLPGPRRRDRLTEAAHRGDDDGTKEQGACPRGIR